MRRGMRAARAALLVATGLLLGTGVTTPPVRLGCSSVKRPLKLEKKQ